MSEHPPSLAVTVALLACFLTGSGCHAGSPSAASGSQAFAVTGVSPESGPAVGATVITIHGRGFASGATLSLGGAPATSVTVTSATTLIATAPVHPAGAVDVVVINPDGRRVSLPKGYTYTTVVPVAVTALTPNVGSTAGGTPVIVTGSGFGSGTVVTFDKIRLNTVFHEGALYLSTGPRAAGPVEVVVANPGSEAITLAAGFTYAPSSTFDFNGEWEGGTGPEWNTPVRFRVANNILVHFSCGNTTSLIASPQPSVRGGEFVLTENSHVVATGRITSSSHAVGTINIVPCGVDSWFARKKS